MKVHQLASKSNATARRRGRGDGSGRGNFSGRGCNGQNARAGGGVRLGFEGGQTPLVQRMPKLRGFRNPNHEETQAVSLEWMELHYKDGDKVTIESLWDRLKLKSGTTKVKILGDGKIAKKLAIQAGVLTSASAKAAITKAGGTVAEEKVEKTEKTKKA